MDFDIQPGFYGKIPARGDFVSRRLSTAFVETWDQWLQSGIAASKEQLGNRWLSAYLTSPIWHFILSPGICRPTAWTGILMPSVDRVGRYFPLTLATPVDADIDLAEIFINAAAWFDSLEQLAMESLEEELDLDELDRKVIAQPLLHLLHESEQVHPGTFTHTENQLAFYVSVDAPEKMNDAFVHLGCRLLEEITTTYSIWRTNGSETNRPCLRIYRHLPRPDEFLQLLTIPAQPYFDSGPDSISQQEQLSAGTPSFAHEDERFSKEAQDADFAFWVAEDYPGNLPDRKPADCMGKNCIQWQSFAATTAGKTRRINEDSYLERSQAGIWAVADGMGGFANGDLAGKTVIDALSTLVPTGSLESLSAYAVECLHAVNQKLYEKTGKSGQGQVMGTTIVLLLAAGERCCVIWAGDSRLYQFRDGCLTQLTRDHSMVAEFSQADGPALEDRQTENLENAVTRAVGGEEELELETLYFDAKDEDVYLLCSDGLYKEVNHEEIAAMMQAGNCPEIAQNLIERSMACGAKDNVTVVVARLSRDDSDGNNTQDAMGVD